MRRGARLFLRLLVVLLVLGWWFVLCIEADDSWPPPSDAVRFGEARAVTEDFLRQDDVAISDLAIPLAPSMAESVQFFSDGPQFFPPMWDDMATAQSLRDRRRRAADAAHVPDEFPCPRRPHSRVRARRISPCAGRGAATLLHNVLGGFVPCTQAIREVIEGATRHP